VSGIFEEKVCETDEESVCAVNYLYDAFKSDFYKVTCVELCPVECQSVSYVASASYSDYPSREYYEVLKNNPILMKLNGNTNENLTLEILRESVACVYFYFGELKYTEIKEFPSISIISLVSNIGKLFYENSNRIKFEKSFFMNAKIKVS
jgi:hypothetical protein